MIGRLLLRPCGDGGQARVGGRGHRAPPRVGERGVEQLADDGVREIAIRLLDQQHVAPQPDVAEVGEIVLVVARPLRLGGERVERPGLADQVEADIGQRQLLLEHRRMPGPFRQPVPQHQRVVGPPQREGDDRRIGHRDRGGRHLTCARRRPAPRRRSGAGRSWMRSARTSCRVRRGREAVIAPDGTTQIDSPSPRRV